MVAAVAGAAALVATAVWGPPRACRASPSARSRCGRSGAAWAAGSTAGFLYMTLAMGALLVFRDREPEGVLLILWLVLVVVAADVGAYFVGRRVGGRKLWPRVSPGKTWSGAFGGLAFAVAVGLIFSWLVVGWHPLRMGS